MTEVLGAADPANIVRVAALLRDGGIAVVPTDTVYGLAASIFQAAAIERVFAAKRRPPEQRVPVLLATAADLSYLTEEPPVVAWKLIDRFWPGGLTLVMKARPGAPQGITRGGDTVAVRVPAGRTVLSLLQVLGEPIVGTSANVSGQPSALTAAQALEQLDGTVDAILEDVAAIQAGVSSTIVDLTGRQPAILRVGAISADEIRDALGGTVRLLPPR